jgi:tetratricopeptide (TPR) repeat protein
MARGIENLNSKAFIKRYFWTSSQLGTCAFLILSSGGATLLSSNWLSASAALPTSFERGCNEMMKKRFREAISCFTEGINTNDKDANSYFRRGQCFLCINEIDKAISDFDRAIAITEGNDQYYLWRGTANAQLGNDEPAIEDFMRAFRINPELVVTYNKQMATAGGTASPVVSDPAHSVQVGNGSNATKDFSEAVKRASQHLTAHFRAGLIYSGVDTQNQDTGEKKVVYPVSRAVNKPRHKGNPFYILENAKHDWDAQVRALDAYEGNAAALFDRALDFQMMGDNDKANLDFERLVELKPLEPRNWLARAYFFHTIGNDEKSRQNVLKAQELDLTLPTKIDFAADDIPAAALQK